jgi:hypothetical protein
VSRTNAAPWPVSSPNDAPWQVSSPNDAPCVLVIAGDGGLFIDPYRLSVQRGLSTSIMVQKERRGGVWGESVS